MADKDQKMMLMLLVGIAAVIIIMVITLTRPFRSITDGVAKTVNDLFQGAAKSAQWAWDNRPGWFTSKDGKPAAVEVAGKAIGDAVTAIRPGWIWKK